MTVQASPPSAESQLNFLGKLQRLFAEGEFVATYKFALLLSLAELAVEHGADDGSILALTTRQVADRFIQLYWRHAMPYGSGRAGTVAGVLIQNAGSQAAVLTAIGEFRSAQPLGTVQQARSAPGYAELVTRVAAVVSAQPLKYLQNFGGVTDPFLYERPAPGAILLKPGVAFCLRRFFPLVQRLSRGYWVEHVKKNRRNQAMLGDAGDLEDFLFSPSRQALAAMGAALRKLDGPRCFYCRDSLDSADVDHFIPFTMYSRDLGQNLVLAHPKCNRSKSDSLAAKPHLERWMERLWTRCDQLEEIAAEAGLAGGAATVRSVAAWGYASASATGGRAWISPANYETVSDLHLALLEDGGAGS